MKLEAYTGVKNYQIAAIVLACAAPAGALNIWPRVEQMLSEGFSGHQFGVVLLVTMSALGMTAIPFAMAKAANWGFWTTCAVFGTFLAGLNYALAVGAIGKAKDHETNSAAFLVSESQRLKKQLSELKAAGAQASSFKYTSEEMVESAREAIKLAIIARDQECGKVGDNCRARVAQLTSRQSELAGLLADREATRKADGREDALRDLETRLLKLGSIPERIDPQAERLSGLLQAIGFTTSTQRVADGLISILAIAAEAFALLMPRILVTALGPTVLVASAAFLPGTRAPAQTALPKPPAKPPSPTAPGPIAPWLRTCRPARGSKLECWTAYTSYKKFCNGQFAPVSYTAFMFEMNGLAKKVEEAGKAYFTF